MRRFPKPCRQRYASGNRQDQLYISLPQSDGIKKRIYFGPYNDPLSHQNYNKMKLEWEAGRLTDVSRPIASSSPPRITIAELFELFLLSHKGNWAREPNGYCTNAHKYVSALGALGHYGDMSAASYSSKLLRQWLQGLGEEHRLARSTINGYLSCVRKVIEWGALNDYIPESVHISVSLVKPLKQGETAAVEHGRRETVDFEVVEQTLEHLYEPAVTVIRILMRTGARPGEVCKMSLSELDTTTYPGVWVYSPTHHKNARRGKERHIILHAPEQKLLTAYIKREKIKSGYIFRAPRPQAHKPAPCYTSQMLQASVKRVCRAYNIPYWSPYQIRHSVASQMAREYGVETTRALLGHTSITTTDIYIHRDIDTLIDLASPHRKKRRGKGK